MEAKKTSPKILVIDDDPMIVKLLQTLLVSNGFEVQSSLDAPEGLEIAIKGSPELIILDVMMPLINGFNICRLMKTQESCKGIPIIILTSRATENDRRIAEEVGADAYVAKPFKAQELLDKIRSLISKTSP
jgi:DNA-binding response OmpR family regulator